MDDTERQAALHWEYSGRDEDVAHEIYHDDAAVQAAEVERLIALGARRVEWDYPAGADYIVLADPEGNRFCVIDTGRG